jgi:hypothetical protein
MNNAQKYLQSLSVEDRKALLSRAGKSVRKRKNLFRDGEVRSQDAGRRGGQSTAEKRAAIRSLAARAEKEGE